MTKIYAKISSIIKAWGSTPYEWGLEEDADHSEIVRFVRQESGQWQLERQRRGVWNVELQDLFDDTDVMSVGPVGIEWVE